MAICPDSGRMPEQYSRMSDKRGNIKKDIGSITMSGLATPPVQNSVQSLSTWLLNSPFIISSHCLLFL